MYRELELLTTQGVKPFAFEATGSTAPRYRMVFHQDLLKEAAKLQGFDKGEGDSELPGKLAYIMNAAAEKKNMSSLSEEGYLDFLDQFEGDTMIKAAQDIFSIYLANQFSDSTSKK